MSAPSTASAVVPGAHVAAADEEFDVVVVGYGPTGQAAASLLARLGHRVCVIERWPSLYGMPRLCAIDGEAVRIVQAAGDVERAMAESSEVRSYDMVAANGDVLVSVDHRRRSSGYHDRISMYQPNIEDAMDAAARERGATIYQGWEVSSVTQDADRVAVFASTFQRGPEEVEESSHKVIHARYVIGADGGRSPVRESVGAERTDLGFHDAYLSIDVNRRRDLDIPDDVNITYVDPLRNTARIPIGKNRIRFELLVNPDDDHSELLVPETGYDLLDTMFGLTREDVEIYRQVIYHFEGQIADEWRYGRVFLAGDAAHQMPPFAGQGACSGLRDSINLAWKLDLVLRGVSEDELLDTYTTERRPHALAVTERAITLGRIACVRDPEEAARRDERLRAGHQPVGHRETPGMAVGVLHRTVEGDVVEPVGDLAPQGVVTYDGRTGRFDDIVGWGFVLLGREVDPSAELGEDQHRFLKQIGCHITTISQTHQPGTVLDVDGDYEAAFETSGAVALLLRPDFTIFGAVSSVSEVPDLVEDLRRQIRWRA